MSPLGKIMATSGSLPDGRGRGVTAGMVLTGGGKGEGVLVKVGEGEGDGEDEDVGVAVTVGVFVGRITRTSCAGVG